MASLLLVLSSGLVHAQRINLPQRTRWSGQSGINLLVQGYTSSKTAFSRDLYYAPQRSDAIIQAGPVLAAQAIPNDRLIFDLQVPFMARVGLAPDADFLLPGVDDFSARAGMADITGGAAAILLTEGQALVQVAAQVRFVAPTGKSRFETRMPLGNGFWNVAPSIGVSRSLGPRILLFTEAGRIERLARTFTIGGQPVHLDPKPGHYLAGGIGLLIRENVINLQAERDWIGEVPGFEPRAEFTRIGLQWGALKSYGVPMMSYVGVERMGGRSSFVGLLGFSFRIAGKQF